MREREATFYPDDALIGRNDLDVISMEQAPTLDSLFRERVRRTPNNIAYGDYDFELNRWRDYSWREVAEGVALWQSAMRRAGMQQGDHVAMRLRNCLHWVIFDQAALGLGLVVVPLYVADRADNANYVLKHAHVKLLLVETLQDWMELEAAHGEAPLLTTVVVVKNCQSEDRRVVDAASWLSAPDQELAHGHTHADELASIVYTSGTTGRPKGVMLSHTNIVANAYAGLRSIAVTPNDVLLSFLPMSHMLERTVGYYLPIMAGAKVAFARSIPKLSQDFLTVRPTGVITVPRIFERAYTEIKTKTDQGPALQKYLFGAAVRIGWRRFEWRQGRGSWALSFLLWPLLDRVVAAKVRLRFGGRMRLAVVGGAPLPLAVSKMFLPLEINLLQGYGLTESSPSISINTLERNRPATIGLPLRGVSVKIGSDDELLAKGPNIMVGYWKNEEATRSVLRDGWLHSGDQVRIDDGFITIIGRIKDILVLANGEKIPPADMESAITADALFDQAMVIGEQMPYLTALVVLNKERWSDVALDLQVPGDDQAVLGTEQVEDVLLQRIAARIGGFPGYAKVQRVTAMLHPWTVANNMLTPTLKLKRSHIRERYQGQIAKMYEGHQTFKTEVRRNT